MIVPNKSAIKFDCMSKNSTSSTFATASHDCVFYLAIYYCHMDIQYYKIRISYLHYSGVGGQMHGNKCQLPKI